MINDLNYNFDKKNYETNGFHQFKPFEILDRKGNLLETIEDDSQFDIILEEAEKNPSDISYFLWDVDMVERLAETEDDSDIRLLKKI